MSNHSDMNDLINAMIQFDAAMDPEDPNAQMNELAEQLSSTTIQESSSASQGKKIYITPSITLNDDILLLAGANTQQNPSSPKLTPKGIAAQAKYGHYLQYEGTDLASATLPTDKEELNALGTWISDGLWMWHVLGYNILVFSPLSHPNYPCWLPDHCMNKMIRNAFDAMIREDDDNEDEMDLS